MWCHLHVDPKASFKNNTSCDVTGTVDGLALAHTSGSSTRCLEEKKIIIKRQKVGKCPTADAPVLPALTPRLHHTLEAESLHCLSCSHTGKS